MALISAGPTCEGASASWRAISETFTGEKTIIGCLTGEYVRPACGGGGAVFFRVVFARVVSSTPRARPASTSVAIKANLSTFVTILLPCCGKFCVKRRPLGAAALDDRFVASEATGSAVDFVFLIGNTPSDRAVATRWIDCLAQNLDQESMAPRLRRSMCTYNERKQTSWQAGSTECVVVRETFGTIRTPLCRVYCYFGLSGMETDSSSIRNSPASKIGLSDYDFGTIGSGVIALSARPVCWHV